MQTVIKSNNLVLCLHAISSSEVTCECAKILTKNNCTTAVEEKWTFKETICIGKLIISLNKYETFDFNLNFKSV